MMKQNSSFSFNPLCYSFFKPATWQKHELRILSVPKTVGHVTHTHKKTPKSWALCLNILCIHFLICHLVLWCCSPTVSVLLYAAHIQQPIQLVMPGADSLITAGALLLLFVPYRDWRVFYPECIVSPLTSFPNYSYLPSVLHRATALVQCCSSWYVWVLQSTFCWPRASSCQPHLTLWDTDSP